MREKLIQQQLYTRERGGVFHSTDGYDTIAISKNLEKTFVKKYLHPICVYNTPNELKRNGEKDAEKYPPAFTVIQPELGEMIVGQSVFVPADFTGQRSTFFMHNYVIPSELKENWIKNPDKIFHIQSFNKHYDIENGQEISEVSSVPFKQHDILTKRDELFRALELDEDIFKKLLYAFISSVFTKKKVYITLNVSLMEQHLFAKLLLELVFTYMPYAARRKFGAVTFSNEPESKKYVNVLFVEAGSLQSRDRTLDKQYIFDFSSKQIVGMDLEGKKHEYLEFAWEALKNSARLDDFFEFAERMLSGLEDPQINDFSTYYQLCAIYQEIKGDHSFYENNKVGLLNSILSFYNGNIREKTELLILFNKLVKQERIITDDKIVLDYMESVFLYQKIVQQDSVTDFVVRTLNHFKDSPVSLKIWELLEGDKDFYDKVVRYIEKQIGQYSALMDNYLIKKFENTTSIKRVLKEIEMMLKLSPSFIQTDEFKTVTRERILSILKRSDNSYGLVLEMKQFFKNLIFPGSMTNLNEYQSKLLSQSEEILLKRLDVSIVNLEEIEQFGKVFIKNKNHLNKVQKEECAETLDVMETLYSIYYEPMNHSDYFLKHLSPSNNNKVKRAIIRIFINDDKSSNTQSFERLMMAYNDGMAGYNFQGVFSVISQQKNDVEMLQFINWSFRKYQRDPAYVRELKRYLITDPNTIWGNKALRKQLKKIKSKSLSGILKEVRDRRSSPGMRFLRKRGLTISLLISTIIGLAFLVVFIINLFLPDNKINNNVPASNKPAVTTPTNNSETKNQIGNNTSQGTQNNNKNSEQQNQSDNGE